MILHLANKTRFRDDVLKGSEQPYASNHRTLLPTEVERERRVIERKQNGGDNLAPEP
jgi:hypothetical protein